MSTNESVNGSAEQSLSEVFTKIQPAIASKMMILQETVTNGVPVFETERPKDDSVIPALRKEAEEKGYSLIIRKTPGQNSLTMHVLPKIKPRPANLKWNVGLFAATASTVFLAGYISGYPGNPILNALEYLATLFAILLTHEFSHFLVSRRHRIAATLPYFIPSIPPIGTFGAVIKAREPFKDRNQLFDVGLSGPLGGFVVALIATIIGVFTSPIYPASAVSQANTLPFVPLFMYLVSFLVVKPNQVLALNPVAFAAWVGLIVTFLNALPTSQLDGGHVLRAFVDSKLHTTVSFLVGAIMLAVGVLYIQGFIIMAVLMLFLSTVGHPGSLDDYTHVASSRKMLLAVWILILALSLPI
jgi:membrane-associated protease RseP (regulator of RpoE activity)